MSIFQKSVRAQRNALHPLSPGTEEPGRRAEGQQRADTDGSGDYADPRPKHLPT